MACRLAEAEHTLHFREAVVEKSWGIPPPTLTVEKDHGERLETLGRAQRCLSRRRRQARLRTHREAVERAAVAAGWTFHLEGGRMP